ncbi:hypothetical protein [Pseudarthrobacter sp.]|uniref:hypothetical protein n=1 Tax=Pseudarthrobacter sp. TaxID=1934409 RepID=UPI002FC7C4A1
MHQAIVTQAKNLGGVDDLIKSIESDAWKKVLKKSGPALVAVGAFGWGLGDERH